jgi:dihydrodipicolinate synthase/N-acetylneuraminate lyase
MVSPVKGDGRIDDASVKKLVEHLVSNRTLPFILGTTGEAASFSPGQMLGLVRSVVGFVAGRAPVLAGISSNSMELSVDLAKRFADEGVEAAVATLPSYYPIEGEQMYRYFEKLASSIPVPLMIYNMPATTGTSIPPEVADRLSRHPNVAGIKDSERDPERLDHCLELWSGRDDFSFLLGWAAMSVHALSRGADGIVPSTANLVPGIYRRLYEAVREDRTREAEKLQEQTESISMLYQRNRKLNRSIPALKALLSLRQLCGPDVLPPLFRLDAGEEKEFLEEMKVELERLGV